MVFGESAQAGEVVELDATLSEGHEAALAQLPQDKEIVLHCKSGVRSAEALAALKAAGLTTGRALYAAKINANFPANPVARGLPTIQGVLALFDATNGMLLALMDSMEITLRARPRPPRWPRGGWRGPTRTR